MYVLPLQLLIIVCFSVADATPHVASYDQVAENNTTALSRILDMGPREGLYRKLEDREDMIGVSLSSVPVTPMTPVLEDLVPDMDGAVIVTESFNVLRMKINQINIYLGKGTAKDIIGKTSIKGTWYPLLISQAGTFQMHLVSPDRDSLKLFRSIFLKELRQNVPQEDQSRQTVRSNNLNETPIRVYEPDVKFIYQVLQSALVKLQMKKKGVGIALK